MKVLLIRAGALGDTLMLLPAIRQLREKAGIILSGRYPGIDFLRPYVDQCVDFEGSGWHRLFIKGIGMHALDLPMVDHVAAFLNDREGNVMRSLADCLPNAKIDIFPAFPTEKEKVHIAMYMAQSLEGAGLPLEAGYAIDYSRSRPLMTGCHQPPMGKRKIVLHPGSGSIKKNYPPDIWIELVGVLLKICPDQRRPIVLLLGPSEECYRSFFQERLNGMNTELLFCPEKDQLLSVLGKALLYIGHDSGITHMAAMLGTPVIALFKDSSLDRWAPLGPAVRIMKNKKGGSDFIKDIAQEGIRIISRGPA